MENKEQRDRNRDKNLDDMKMNREESTNVKNKEKRERNRNWDQVQRRQQASPRSYSENTESENIENQNTRAKDEQVDEETHNDLQGGDNNRGRVGDKASERQQTIDKENASKDRRVD
ncbi:hypothetical protein FHG64_16495 [Antarcticibacterium flavum]|uniref:Uncharacterized protein n=1 Tax=Antarcticibacterium flavum TaxID=2058175 RepID=A0A5B7X5T5_9FLAO|nr:MULTISPECIES: hypothetical protein [Antarcticibacterium]MCM4159617.1 hypothetical protein [Antarcticibacterium sp. W02-3]QCY70864.1 hypothetical protein FHG64_16495 [Antarcticibacterium flavum]